MDKREGEGSRENESSTMPLMIFNFYKLYKSGEKVNVFPQKFHTYKTVYCRQLQGTKKQCVKLRYRNTSAHSYTFFGAVQLFDFCVIIIKKNSK